MYVHASDPAWTIGHVPHGRSLSLGKIDQFRARLYGHLGPDRVQLDFTGEHHHDISVVMWQPTPFERHRLETLLGELLMTPRQRVTVTELSQADFADKVGKLLSRNSFARTLH